MKKKLLFTIEFLLAPDGMEKERKYVVKTKHLQILFDALV